VVGGSAGAVIAVAAIVIPTGVVPTVLYTRMAPVQWWWNYPVLALTAALEGAGAGLLRRFDTPARQSAEAGTRR
jgi:hypothetical protein